MNDVEFQVSVHISSRNVLTKFFFNAFISTIIEAVAVRKVGIDINYSCKIVLLEEYQ